ncbi:MAG: hypothetical protein BBJ57_08070 [Desulfobacterales bacterium PC51MH44]|nr:MAG: hypothetical protein BBJ57_08070 [Desulfobacterales bacterium PC51MH44]
MSDPVTIKVELLVIGTGMAGNAAALFAANRGLSVAQVGCTAEIIFASGFLDLMGAHPIQEKRLWHDPWAGIDAVSRDIPGHPYARLNREDIQDAFEELLSFLNSTGIPYCRHQDRNVNVLTPIGTFKPTYCVPQTMWAGVKAVEDQRPCLIIDFRRLKGFSARQIAAGIREKLPEVSTASISFPDFDHMDEVYPEHMAWALESSEKREKLSQIIGSLVGNSQVVGIPAILGIYRTKEILSDLEKRIGVPIFEIPTMPPSVTGLRLKEAFEQHLSKRGVRLFTQKRVIGVKLTDKGEDFIFDVGNNGLDFKIYSHSVILASGRFLGKGLRAEKKQIKETIFGLPVHQPWDRSRWHLKDFFDPRGHPINRAGLEVDDLFRPLDRSGHPVFRMLFAVGSILAHQDWMRMKCGSGLAIATAYGAVNALLKLKGQ